jgi:hypothetical protein
MDDPTKLIIAVLGAGSLGGLGGHTIGSGVSPEAAENCKIYSQYAHDIEHLKCMTQKLQMQIDGCALTETK